MNTQWFTLDDPEAFKENALRWATAQGDCCCFNSNGYADPYSAFDFLLAAGVKDFVKCGHSAFSALQEFLDRGKRWLFGFLSYDLKNELESLHSANPDKLGFPLLYFFEPLHLVRIKGNRAEITAADPGATYRSIRDTLPSSRTASVIRSIQQKLTRNEYLEAIGHIREHIRRGDIYELNYCQEFYAEEALIDPAEIFIRLNRVSPSPFSTFFREGNRYLLSSTPERFLGKRGTKLISQPIKGTAKRDVDPIEDQAIARRLHEDEKEQAENVMIVDLVRNDLTRCALPGTVRVEELFGIYRFSQVYQMISTVVCEVDPQTPLTGIIRALFPMGSMTGAPKVSAMKLIESYEKSKRGLFSGAAGYFAPNGDFDFNVIIRSILYNADQRYLSFQAGSAITFDSVPEKEYEECLLKVGGIVEVLSDE